MKTAKIIIFFAVIIAIAGCSSTVTRRSAGETYKDYFVISKIKYKIGEDPLFNSRNIDVESWKGKVTLKGSVVSDTEKMRVEEIARNVKGVNEVENNLVIGEIAKPEPTPVVSDKKTAEPAQDSPKKKFAKSVEEPMPAAKITEEELKSDPIYKDELTAVEHLSKSKKQNAVSYQIGKEIAETKKDQVSTDDITKQAEDELKELRAKKKK